MATDEWSGWEAVITPTEYGTWGIEWRNAPAMERRGGWSGPYDSPEDAIRGAKVWADSWRLADLTIRQLDPL